MPRIIYQTIAAHLNARNNCVSSNMTEWKIRHEELINQIIKNHFPHGSGIDGELYLDFDNSRDNRLIINSAFHAMNDIGYYVKWIHFKIIIVPDLQFGFSLSIRGNFGNYQDIKDYLLELFDSALKDTIEENIYHSYLSD